MARKKLKSATDQRKFTLVYNDFLESNLLNHYEKSVFIALKKYADNDTMRAFPSLNKLHEITGISLSQVRRSIDHMKKLGVISVEHRLNEDKGHQSNIYTLYDYAEIWSVESGSSEDVAAVADEISELKLVAELRARGYIVTKEKGLETEPSKAQNQAPNNQLSKKQNTTNEPESQAELYSMEQIQEYFDYTILIADHPEHEADLQVVFDILHEALNTSKPTIRVSGEDKPKGAVVGKLMKLTHYDIEYAIDKFHEQTGKIKNTRAYLLTILYHSREQSYLDLMNLGHRNGDF